MIEGFFKPFVLTPYRPVVADLIESFSSLSSVSICISAFSHVMKFWRKKANVLNAQRYYCLQLETMTGVDHQAIVCRFVPSISRNFEGKV
jgi:hypothetical protein